MLHITNGDCAVAVLSRAVQGAMLPWQDVLHEGPVHAGIPLEDLSRRRAAFIASAGWAPLAAVEEKFAARNALLHQAIGHDEVVLWFEHDLYDQLQLIQLLDWFRLHPHPELSLVCEAEYLGDMTPARAVARRAGVPDDLRSCHTATIDGYAVEGHVPAADIRRLLAERPEAAGIAVPGMPIGSPGMEQGGRRQPFQTMIFTRDGRRQVFARH